MDDDGPNTFIEKEDLERRLHNFPTLAAQQTLFGAETQNMRLSAGVQKDGGLFGTDHLFGGSQ